MRCFLMGCALAGLMMPATLWACESDSECKGDRICVDGACAAPGSQTEPTESATTTSATDAPSTDAAGGTSSDVGTSGMSLFADIGAILGYGLSVGAEFGGPIAGFVQVRSLFLGVAPQVIALSEVETLSAKSFDIGGGVRIFSNGRTREGLYYGGGLELIFWTSIEDDADPGEEYYDAHYNATGIALFGQGGYRWLWPSGSYIAVGGSLGIGTDVSATTVFADGNEKPGDKETIPVLMANFEVGTML